VYGQRLGTCHDLFIHFLPSEIVPKEDRSLMESLLEFQERISDAFESVVGEVKIKLKDMPESTGYLATFMGG